MDHEMHDLFPLGIYRGPVSCHEELKKQYFDDRFKKPAKKIQQKELEKKFQITYFKLILAGQCCIIPFVKILVPIVKRWALISERVLFHVTRSWYDHREPDTDRNVELNDIRYDLNNNNKSEEEIKEGLGWGNIRELPVIPHWHQSSDLSFVYYLVL